MSFTVVSVVRDWACYTRCIKDNPHLAGATFVTYDNTAENHTIPERYNTFLDAMPAETEWILFAHEDFELREDPRPTLAACDTRRPYGLVGSRIIANSVILFFGTLSDSDRDGKKSRVVKPLLPYDRILGLKTENFDCCGFFVHADLFRALGLRFDPRCAWDLYAEDLVFQFRCKTGDYAQLLPVKAHHWSRGNPDRDSFREALAHLNQKYADRTFAGGTCTFAIGKRPNWRLRLFHRFARMIKAMKHLLFPLLLGLICTGCSTHRWNLVFEENFDGDGVPNPAVWGYETGYVRNKELQYYTDKPETVFQKDGLLHIRAARAEDGTLYSGSIHTLEKQHFRFGKIEVRAKLPKGQGVWPAIWMLGVNRSEVRWPMCGEIDIMEYVWGTPKTVFSTCHWYDPATEKRNRAGSSITTDAVLDGDWHLYTVEWTPETITFFFDNIQHTRVELKDVPSFQGENPFHRPFYLLLNLAIGGGWGGKLDESILPVTYQVDYVRYWQKSGE